MARKRKKQKESVDQALMKTRQQQRQNLKRRHADVELETEDQPIAKKARKKSEKKSKAARTRAVKPAVNVPFHSPEKKELYGKTTSFLSNLTRTLRTASHLSKRWSSRRAPSEKRLYSDVTVSPKLRLFVERLGEGMEKSYLGKNETQKILRFPHDTSIGGKLTFLHGKFLIRKCYEDLYRIILDLNAPISTDGTARATSDVTTMSESISTVESDASTPDVTTMNESVSTVESDALMPDDMTKFMIQGNPGIGKSLFVYYLMNKLIKEGRTVVWQPATFNVVVCIKNKKAYYSKTLDMFEHELNQRDTWYVVDAKIPEDKTATTLLVCSPDQAACKAYRNDGPEIFYIPVWEQEELQAAFSTGMKLTQSNKLTLTVADIEKGFKQWGGIPRYVFQFAYSDDQQLSLTRAIKNLDLQNLSRFLGETKGDDASHKVIHLIVDKNTKEPYTKYIMDFASEHVKEQIVDLLRVYNRERIAQFIGATQGVPQMASLRGVAFESYAHTMLAVGGKFNIRKLGSQDTSILELRPSSTLFFRATEKLLYSNGDYYQPYWKTFPAVDALLFPNILLQMTVSEEHRVSKGWIKKLVNHMAAECRRVGQSPEEFRLYFVIPPELFEDFKEQRYKNKNGADSKQPLVFEPPVKLVQYALELCVTSDRPK